MTDQSVLFKIDLIMSGAHPVQSIECPYLNNENWETAMDKVYLATLRASQRKQRINALIYAFYMGKLIDSSVTPREKWLEYVQQKSIKNAKYMYLGAVRVYQLFAFDVGQIYRTQHMTLRKLTRLKNQEFKALEEFRNDYERDFVIQ